MSEDNMGNSGELKTDETSEVAHKLAVVGWSLFFIWVGVALLAKITPGVGLLGVGIITLGMQATRKYFSLKLEWFWLVIGLLFVLGGIWDLFEAELPLVPILLIVAGLALLFSILRGKHPMRKKSRH
jgi:hypothetical protein